VDWNEPLPLDTPAACRQFLLRFKPLALLIARTDVWPEMLYQCHRSRIPMILFSATFAENKANAWLRGILVRWLYPLLQELHCVSKDDEIQLRRLLPKSTVTASGDTRYDQVLYRLSHRKTLKENLKPRLHLQTLVAGSTWPEDESVLFPAVQSLLNEKRLQIVLAPHEPTPSHLLQLKEQLTQLGVTIRAYSEADEFNLGEVLIVDQVGILADLYSWGSMAFVGGSFRGSVHSVMEPLGSGAVTMVGPYHHNNREALEFKHKSLNPQLHMVQACRTSEELSAALGSLLQLGPSRAAWPELIVDQVLKKSGASIQLAQSLGNKLNLR
jgi:3-deoxy-D-manno-octulosonic-acid transferase